MICDFATSKGSLSSISLLAGNDGFAALQHHAGMDDQDDEIVPIFLGEWIRALETTQAAVARGTGLSETYISQLIDGSKNNPTLKKLSLIVQCLDIPISAIFEPPPDVTLVDRFSKLPPRLVDRLKQRRLPRS